MDHKQTTQPPLMKSFQSRSQKTIQPKQPASVPLVNHKVKKTPEFPIQIQDSPNYSNLSSPEKAIKTKPHTLVNTLKTQSTAGESVKTTPLSIQKSLFPVKSVARLKQNSNSNLKINPKMLVPVLTARKAPLLSVQSNERSIDPIKEMPDYFQSLDSFSQPLNDYENSIEGYDRYLNESTPDMSSSVGYTEEEEEETESEPNFLSGRVSYECDSDQSLKKFENFYSSVVNDGQNVLATIQEKFDSCTQTEKNEIVSILSSLDKHEIVQGMQFLSKLYNLLENIIKI